LRSEPVFDPLIAVDRPVAGLTTSRDLCGRKPGTNYTL
jgi:hypothetical protein